MSDLYFSTLVNTELERTDLVEAGGASRVSSRERSDAGRGAVSDGSSPEGQTSSGDLTTNPVGGGASPPDGKRFTRLVGFKKLKDLLQPVHRFFSNKKAWLEPNYTQYSDKDVDLVYPNIKAEKGNPYRKHQLTHKSSTRTYKRIRRWVESHKLLDDFKVCDLTLTMPKFMSEYLAKQGKQGREAAWRMFEGFWTEDLPEVVKQPGLELAGHFNLHVWRTQQPLEPHFHFHCLIPNFGLHIDERITDENGDPALTFNKWNWYRQRGGKRIEVPFSDAQLGLLKKLWADRLKRFCKRHSLEWVMVLDKETNTYREQKIDIYVYGINEWVKFLHKLNYVSRSWLEDFANYSNANPECPDPPDWLADYGNKSRVKGWWSNLKEFTVEDTEKEKISPYTGEKMTYVGKVGISSLMSSDGFGYVDFVKGRACESEFSNEELEWLGSKTTYSDAWIKEVDHLTNGSS